MDPLTLLATSALRMAVPRNGSGSAQNPPVEIISADTSTALDSAAAIDRWQPMIAEAARRFDIPEAWIRAVMRAESGGQTRLNGNPITSPAGAMGLMQLMPETYQAMRLRYGLGTDPYIPRDNILAGAAYLRELYDAYGYPALFAAYNAGPRNLNAYLWHGLPLPHETVGYLARISPNVQQGVLSARSIGTAAATNSLSPAGQFAGGFAAPTASFFDISSSNSHLVSLPNRTAPSMEFSMNSGQILVGNGKISATATPKSPGSLFVPLGKIP